MAQFLGFLCGLAATPWLHDAPNAAGRKPDETRRENAIALRRCVATRPIRSARRSIDADFDAAPDARDDFKQAPSTRP
jgi:hypothetical protein